MAALALVIAVPLVTAPGWADPVQADPDVQAVTPVASRPLQPERAPVIPPDSRLPASTWPAPGVAEVDLPEAAADAQALSPAEGKAPTGAIAPSKAGGRVRAGSLPVFVGRPASPAGASSQSAEDAAAGSPSRIRVEMLGRAEAKALNLPGVLFRVDRVDGQSTPGTAEVVVDYTGFRAVYGGGWGNRLRIVQYPACALTTPDKPECAKGTEVATRNDTGHRQVIAELTVEPAATPTADDAPAVEPSASPWPVPTTSPSPSPSVSPTPSTSPESSVAPGSGGMAESSGSVFAVTAASSSGGGSYAAQPLASQAEWSTSGGSGDFSWSYPMRVPPVPTGLAPKLGLSYSSGVADGQTSASNNQASGAGLGFDLGTPYIERKYSSCAYNGHNTGDLCWKYDNAYLVLNGVATELVKESNSEWYARKDPGWRIRRLQGNVGLPSRDSDDERWVVTTQDGTQYHFGQSYQPGTGDHTNSAWTAPVYALKSGDPCWTGTFETSHCTQAWRWNLDYVVDRKGNSMTYFYEEEGNYYGRGNDPYAQTYYIRGGSLIGIEYGNRIHEDTRTPPAKVAFYNAFRCLSGADSCGSVSEANYANYPDAPMDQLCTNVQACQNHSPTFFSLKRLRQIVTHVRNPADTQDGWQAVDSYDFDFRFYGTADDPVDPALMLTSVTHSGQVGTAVKLGPTWFEYKAMHNRVDIDTANGSPEIQRHRVENIYDDSGGRVNVNYAQPHNCNAASLPNPSANSTNCFPAWWKPENRPGELGWFRKYLVTKVVDVDRTGLTHARYSTYGYQGSPAWHWDDKGSIVPEDQQSWGQWRGYAKVLVTEGAYAGAYTRTENHYFRGLHGDRNRPAVSVTNSWGEVTSDSDFLEGQLWETRSVDGDSGAEISATAHGFFLDKTWDGGFHDAWITIPASSYTRTRLSGGGYRYTKSQTTYENGTALPLKQINYGEVNADRTDKVLGDETCAATTYARNTSLYRMYPSRVEARAGTGCASADALLSRTETFYDGNDALTDAPTNGLPSKARVYKDDSTFLESTMTYDRWGRPTSATDPLGRTSTTAYTPADIKPTTKVVTTNAKGWAAQTTLAPWWASPTSITDANNRVTDLSYDPLGRITRVWLPGHPKSGPASKQFAYGIGITTPSWSKTSSLHSVAGDGAPTYLDSWTYYDGFGGAVETQTDAPGGTGRLVTALSYDARGLLQWTANPFYNTGVSGSGVVNPLPADLSRTENAYDSLERPTSSAFYAAKATSPKWKTTTSYGGDRTTVTPPVGGAKTTIVDGMGRTASLVEQTDSGTNTTTYGYSRRGELTRITDAKGNITRYTYNQLGQRTKAEDPDAGTTTYDYDNVGRPSSSTDARGKTIVTAYDDLDRKIALREGSATGPELARWTYDTLPGGKGLPVAATSFHDGNAYTKAVIGYDEAGRATGSSVTIPSAEGALAGTYSFGVTYDVAGRVSSTTYPQAGGMASEKVTTVYNGLGLPSTLTGVMNQVSKPYVTATSFTQLGQLAKRFYGGGTAGEARRTYSYETDTGRLAAVVAKSGAALVTVQDDRYTYDAAGNAVRVAEYTADGALAAAECFDYDKLNRLTEAWTTTGASCATDPAAGTANGVEPYHLAWTYDSIGNRLTETDKLSATAVTRTSAYPASGDGAARPHAATSVTTPGVATPDTFIYDAAGNMTNRSVDGAKSDFTWDVFGRLDHADTERPNGVGGTVTERTSYVYDADGGRLLRRETGATVLYLGGMELRLTTEGPGSGAVNATRYYTHGGAPVAVRTTGGLHWILNDGQSSAEISVDAETGATTRRRYLPFGGDRSPSGITGAWPTERGFLNKTKDTSTGLLHLGAREYDASNGRFLTPDPLLTPGWSQNTAYAYSANNPIAYSDPSGLQGSASCAPGEVGGDCPDFG